ncbi:septal ring lytic transglycosylase RlpA family protein [Hymenobacter pini]|uniref:septal ring lytic transglycosylase RlpA family protein n=1 Tax=Hymenobacter pini TaxID=2880879 RepID=UPI001CF46C2B|nr:septal ring lytic transglycosylase RlpA family protein [Hymenobacter pini]MCA8832500.1 septal ring lytic transglycosylase RlpA family protein [Hymenobacter pini]
MSKQPLLTLVGTRLLLLLLSLVMVACATGRNTGTYTESGIGTYYADKFEGRPTASGTVYRGRQLTAAHRTLAFGTVVRVTNPRNGRSVEVTITDRGPHVKGRIIDLSKEAARRIGIFGQGMAPVELRVVRAAPDNSSR